MSRIVPLLAMLLLSPTAAPDQTPARLAGTLVRAAGTAPKAAARPPARPDRDVRAARTARGRPPPSSYKVAGVWHRLAECESDGRWGYNGPSGYDGGLQFHPSTWAAYRDPTDPPYAYLATPTRQIEIAERVLAAQGWGAWPACSRKLNLR